MKFIVLQNHNAASKSGLWPAFLTRILVRQRGWALLLAVTMGIGFPARASDAGGLARVDNFALIDHRGRFHELYYYENDPETRAIVMFVQGNGCPLVRKRIPELSRLARKYGPRGVRFCMINANPQDTHAEIADEAEAFGIGMPILVDSTQLVARHLELERTAEVLVIEPGTWVLRYRGAISDRLDYEATKPEADHDYLAEALEALLAGEPVQTPRTSSPGCKISFLGPDQPASYAETIAPLLENRCVRCHREGGIAPFAMSSYRKVRGWSEMIEEVVLTQRMPPWQADPLHGRFSNDFSLTDEEARILVTWIRAGSPRGEGEDPLPKLQPIPTTWTMGEPDHLVEVGEQRIPAEGIIDYRYVTVDLPFEEPVWVRAVDIRPGNTRVLHHVIATIVWEANGKTQRRALAGYAPGMGPDQFPDGTGIQVPAGASIRFQLHYTASGRPETDATRLGLYFFQQPPEKVLHSGLAIQTKFRIPPRTRAYTIAKTNVIKRDILLHSMNPHMHYRGKAMNYVAHLPDGRREVLLSVPHYHFNWQRNYRLAQPKFLPAGTRLVVTATWDNSPLNPYNPDPDREVGWGEQSFDEMFFASYRYTLAEEGSAGPRADRREDP